MAEREFPAGQGAASGPLDAMAPTPPKEAKREKKVEKIEGLGEVVVKKPSLGERFKKTFFGGDAKGTASYVWASVLVPTAKNMFLDAIQQGSERMVLGEVRTTSRNSTIPNLLGLGHQAYNRMYANGPMPGNGGVNPMLNKQAQHQARATHDFSQFVLASRAAAELVIDRMYDLLSRDGCVTVADFLDLLGEDVDYTMQRWGWIDLGGSQIRRIPQGYLLDLPRPVPLD